MNEEREEMIEENSMLLQEIPENEQKLEYKEKEDEQLFGEEDNKLNGILAIQDDAKTNLATKEGYQNYEIIRVDYYKEPVKLVNIETGDLEELELSVVIAQDPYTLEIIEIYYLDGKEADLSVLMKKYESPTPIKDLVDSKEPYLELYDEREQEELIEIIEFEDEKKIKNPKNKYKEENNNIIGQKPLNVIQRIDPHKTYVNGMQTVSNVFNLSSDVHELVIAYPQKGDKEALSGSITLYMLDKDGNIMEKSNGKKINELFEIDSATGINSMSDDSTRTKLDGTSEQDANRTMARFNSKEDNKSTISIDQKKTMGHHEVYAGSKAIHSNSDVEVELDKKGTGNIQTNLNAQRVVDYGDGIHKGKEVDEEARQSVEKGEDKEKIAIENADGKENTAQIENNPYIPGTEMTWEELSEETGESITVLQERFERELEAGKEPADILGEIEYDYEMTGHEHEHRFF